MNDVVQCTAVRVLRTVPLHATGAVGAIGAWSLLFLTLNLALSLSSKSIKITLSNHVESKGDCHTQSFQSRWIRFPLHTCYSQLDARVCHVPRVALVAAPPAVPEHLKQTSWNTTARHP
jgi:hypothetical protein